MILIPATDLLFDYANDSIAQQKRIVSKYYIEDAHVGPTLAILLLTSGCSST